MFATSIWSLLYLGFKKGPEQSPTFASAALHKLQAAHGGPELFNCCFQSHHQCQLLDLMLILMPGARKEVTGDPLDNILDSSRCRCQLCSQTVLLTCSKSKVIGILLSSFSKSIAPSCRGKEKQERLSLQSRNAAAWEYTQKAEFKRKTTNKAGLLLGLLLCRQSGGT